MKKQIAAILLAVAAGPIAAQAGPAPFTVRESGQSFNSLQRAVDAIGGGSGTVEIAPGVYRQCAVQNAGRVAYVARDPGSVAFDGAVCEGKAALVLRGQAARIEGIVFRNLRVPDGNGSGIRLEAGDLTVLESLFLDSESGILTAADRSGAIRIEQSTFSGLGRCDRGLDCAHSIYIGDYGSLAVRRVRFDRGRGGHYVKSRAPRVEIVDSSFDDTDGRKTNYMIDLSNGATGTIARNIFVQGKDKENYSAFIVVAPEGTGNSSDGLAIAGNRAAVAPGVDRRTAFVADLSGDSLRIGDNQLGPRIARFERR